MRSETILLVEDESSLRGVMKMFLEHSGYHVMDSDNGPDALYMGTRHEGPIHLLLTDVEMSPMSGPELAEQLLQHRPDTHVLFMSGNRHPDDLQEGLALCKARFLGKPFNPKVLSEVVRESLGVPP